MVLGRDGLVAGMLKRRRPERRMAEGRRAELACVVLTYTHEMYGMEECPSVLTHPNAQR